VKKIVTAFVGLLIVFVTPHSAKADESPTNATPFQFGIWKNVQLVPENYDAWGLRLNFPYGNNANVRGVDLGLVNRAYTFKGIQVGALLNCTMDEMMGIQIGLLNRFRGKDTEITKGVQIGGVGNCGGENMAGIQIGGIINFEESHMTGGQIGGIVNFAKAVTGIQIGGAGNITRDDISGIQIGGICNVTTEMRGVQIALFNAAKKMTGIQIGLVNIIKESSVESFPFFNANF